MKQTLLVIDVLKGIFELGEEVYRGEAFLERIGYALGRARTTGVPVIYLQHQSPPGSLFALGAPEREIHPHVAPRPSERIVEKQHPDAFQGTLLESILREGFVGELVVCGFSTEGCVDSTVRSAYARGFSVILLADAHTTTRNAVLEAAQIVAHHNLVLARFARVLPTSEVASIW